MEVSDRFRGIRHMTAWDPHEDARYPGSTMRAGMLLEAKFKEGFSRLAPLGLSFDAWFFHPQIPDLASLARAFPETSIILDHFGGPLGIGPYEGTREANLPQWRLDIAELAQCPNVVAKLGGINMKVNGFAWHKRERPPGSEELAAATRVYYDHCLEVFGPGRCLFESNFPVDKVSCSYNVLWNTFKRIAAGGSAAEKAQLFHDTAARVYRLDG